MEEERTQNLYRLHFFSKHFFCSRVSEIKLLNQDIIIITWAAVRTGRSEMVSSSPNIFARLIFFAGKSLSLSRIFSTFFSLDNPLDNLDSVLPSTTAKLSFSRTDRLSFALGQDSRQEEVSLSGISWSNNWAMSSASLWSFHEDWLPWTPAEDHCLLACPSSSSNHLFTLPWSIALTGYSPAIAD